MREAATKLGELGYYARIEPGLVPDSGEGVLTLNVASSLEGLARTEEMLAFGRVQIDSQTSKLVLLKFIARSQSRSLNPQFLEGVIGPVPKWRSVALCILKAQPGQSCSACFKAPFLK